MKVGIDGSRGEGEREMRKRGGKGNSSSKTLFSNDCSLGSFRPV